MIGAEKEACSCLAQPHHPHEAEAMLQGVAAQAALGRMSSPNDCRYCSGCSSLPPPQPPPQAPPVRVWSILQRPARLSLATVLPRKHSRAYSPPSSLKQL